LPLTVAAAALALAVACARDQRAACQAFEAKKMIDGSTSTFTLENSPWRVTSTLDAALTIANIDKKTSCSTSAESVLTAYFGRDVVYLRSTDIASDLLLTVNGDSCLQTKAPMTLDGTSEARVNEQLMAIGVCPAS
jgi:hypothetical protein